MASFYQTWDRRGWARKHTCTHTKADGTRCQSYPVRGLEACAVHAGRVPPPKRGRNWRLVWRDVRASYEAGHLSRRAIARAAGVSEAGVRRQAAQGGWKYGCRRRDYDRRMRDTERLCAGLFP